MATVANSAEQWRRYGETRRRALLEEDSKSGGTSFLINRKCRIDKYFALAERVTFQFSQLCEDSENLEAPYVMGHRLVSFLKNALPEHPEYYSLTKKAQRQKCRTFLSYIQETLEKVAIQIDEDQLNTFMDLNFDPTDADTVSSDGDEGEKDGWESFTGWGSAPAAVETDSSSRETNSDDEFRFDLPEEGEEFPDPDIAFFGIPHEDDDVLVDPFQDINDPSDQPCRPMEDGDKMQWLSILEKIANEVVDFETDSDAADSWAQPEDEDQSLIFSASSGMSPTCDPARIAFREIMNRLPRANVSTLSREL